MQQLLDVLKFILEHACKIFSLPHGFVYMPTEEHDMLEVKIGLGYFADFVGYKVRQGQGVGGKVWLSGQSLIVENYQNWDARLKDPCFTTLESIIGVPLKSQGSVVGVIGIDYSGQSQICQDVCLTFERLAELASIAINNAHLTEELRKSEVRFHSLFSNMTEGVSLLEDVTDATGNPIDYRIVDVNPEYERIIGLKRKDIMGKLVTEVYSTEELQFIKNRTLTALTGIPLNFETLYSRRYLAISVIPGGVTGIACIFKDITEQKQAEEKLLYMSYRDALTGVYNRTYFEAELKRIDNLRQGSVALVIIDVDGLKLVNDTLGHDEGDRMLVKAADFLCKYSRQEDIVTRIGGDEFAIVLKEVTAQEAEETCTRLRENLINFHKESADCKFPLRISIGYAFSPDPSMKSVEIFRLADNRMYRDKLHRRGNSRSMILQTLNQMLVERDYYTEEHAARLQDMVDRFARTLGRPESELPDLRLFAQFHDIGKVGISDKILQKSGPLSPKERSEMQRHCEIGQRIAQSSEDLRPIADWILMHHEHWDGGGYPLGLKRENIPIECRIVSIVDAYDAMTSDRPYRKAMPRDAALAEIQRCAGTQFDPSLADSFIQMFPSYGFSS